MQQHLPFDPYHVWLGIPPQEQPPHYYRMLGVPLYEPNPAVIESAADRQIAHVRTFQSGPQREDSLSLLKELVRARSVLLAEEQKLAYDAQLRASLLPVAELVEPAPATNGNHRWWLLAGVAAVLVAGLLVVLGMPTDKRSLTAESRAAAKAALERRDLAVIPSLLEQIAGVDPQSQELAELRAEFEQLRRDVAAQAERSAAEQEGERLWQAAQQALMQGHLLAAKRQLALYLEGPPRARTTEAWELLAECEKASSSAEAESAVAAWTDEQLASAVASPLAPLAAPLPMHPSLALLERQRLVAAARREQELRAVKKAELSKQALAVATEVEDRIGEALKPVGEWLELARRRAFTPLGAARERRRAADAAWAADPRRHGPLAMIPENAAVVILAPVPNQMLARLDAFCLGIGLGGPRRWIVGFARQGLQQLSPLDPDLTRPLAVALTNPEERRSFDLASWVVIAPCPDRVVANRVLKTDQNAPLGEDASVRCEWRPFLWVANPQVAYARLRAGGTQVCYGLDQAAVDRVATAATIAPRLPAEVGEGLLAGDASVMVQTAAWQTGWRSFLEAIRPSIADREDPESQPHAQNFLELAQCLDYGALSVQLDGGLGATAWAVFSPHQDAAVDRIVPLLVSSQTRASVAGLPHDRALWAFAASGDGPSNVVLAHGLLLTAVDHFLVPRGEGRTRTDLHRGITRAFRHMQGIRAALYESVAPGADPPDQRRFSSIVIIDSARPAELLDELRNLVVQVNAELELLGERQNQTAWLTRQLDGQDLHALVPQRDIVNGALPPEAERRLAASFARINLSVEPGAIVLQLGEDIDLLRQCRRNLAERRPGLAIHPAIAARDARPGPDPQVRFHVSTPHLAEREQQALPPNPESYTSSELSLDLTRLRLDFFAPAVELRPWARRWAGGLPDEQPQAQVAVAVPEVVERNPLAGDQRELIAAVKAEMAFANIRQDAVKFPVLQNRVRDYSERFKQRLLVNGLQGWIFEARPIDNGELELSFGDRLCVLRLQNKHGIRQPCTVRVTAVLERSAGQIVQVHPGPRYELLLPPKDLRDIRLVVLP